MMKLLVMVLVMLAIPKVILPWGLAWADNGGNSEAATAGSTGELQLTLTLKYEETSKDANWRQSKAEIDGGKMLLSREYGGFEAPENEYSEKILNRGLEARIWAFIREKKLDVGIEQDLPTQGPGVAGYLNLEIKGPQASSIHLVGKTDIWGSDEYIRENWGPALVASRTNIDRIDYFQKAEAFFKFLWGLEP
jgi:hypothetical protein